VGKKNGGTKNRLVRGLTIKINCDAAITKKSQSPAAEERTKNASMRTATRKIKIKKKVRYR